ncbi:MAG: ECF transporter S component [Oscillospiraceae bacterium]|nr:ECF transporter S component [Oscillospiraceae bacterium]
MKLKKLTGAAILSGLSIALMYLLRIPMPGAPFLEYDMADIPILIGTFAYGPLAGFAMTLVVSVIQGVTVSAASSWYGIVMHVLATGSFVLTAGNLYQGNHTKKGAGIALAFGSLVQVIVMFFANLLITPFYMGMEVRAVLSFMPIIMLFNVLRVIINSAVTFVTYKGVRHVLPK